LVIRCVWDNQASFRELKWKMLLFCGMEVRKTPNASYERRKPLAPRRTCPPATPRRGAPGSPPGSPGAGPRVRSHRCVRNSGADPLSDSGIEWIRGSEIAQNGDAAEPRRRTPAEPTHSLSSSSVISPAAKVTTTWPTTPPPSRMSTICWSEKGVRSAQNIQVGPCIPVEIQL